MNSTPTARLEKVLVVLIALTFVVPLPLGWLLRTPRWQVPATAWLRNATLGGIQVQPAEVPLSAAAVLSDKYQEAAAKNFDFHFTGRELLIRAINELYLDVFNTTTVDVVVGPKQSLIPRVYAEEYCFARVDREMFMPLVDDLRRLQDFCDAQGTPFVFVLTPSKASIYPETLPANWLDRVRPGLRCYDVLVPLLQEKGVRFVDGHRLTVDLKPSTGKVPLFPRGGVHWGDVAALNTGNAMLASLAGQGLKARPIEEYDTNVSTDPELQDFDVASLLNTVSTMHYPVASITVAPMAPQGSRRPNMVLVGGSFLQNILRMLDASRQFSELDTYFYYTAAHRCWLDGDWRIIAEPTPPVNFETDIFATDALVLEANEEYLMGKAENLGKFLHDALAVLPDPHAPKSPFHYSTWADYRWGDTVSLVDGKQPPAPIALSGFSAPTPIGVYTEGTHSAIRLHTPPATENMVLALETYPFLVDTRLTEQQAGIYINDREVADWTWDAATPTHRELAVPREVLGDGGELNLEFRVARPRAPVEFGLSADAVKYGLILASVQLHPEVRIAYQWGDKFSLTENQPRIDTAALSGFSPLIDLGAYTIGPVAMIRLATPPAATDMTLEVDGGAFIVDTRLPEQRVGVFVNGKSVGEWVWRIDTPPHHELVIPKGLLGSGALNLEFRIAHPASPAEFGLSADPLKYGFYISSLRLHPAGK